MSAHTTAYRVLFLLLAVVLTACQRPDGSGSDQQLLELNTKLEEIRYRYEELHIKCSGVLDRLEHLESERQNFEIEKETLSEWSRQLAERFGPSIWYFSKDERPLPVQSLPQATPALLVEELNRLLARDGWPLVILEKIEGDTAFVHISDENQLTQHMGTTGATAYIEAVTYTLSSIQSIDFVEFIFKEGDHAIPGRYSR